MARLRRGAIWGSVLLLFALALASALGYVLWAAQPPATDPDNQCRLDRPPPSRVVILIDATSRLSKAQTASMRAKLRAIAEKQPSFGAVEIAVLSGTKQDGSANLLHLLDICAPKRPDEVSQLTGNPIEAQALWHKFFVLRVQNTAPRAGRRGEANFSPIAESLESLIDNSYVRPVAGPTELVVFSDLVQRSSILSLDGLPANWPSPFARGGQIVAKAPASGLMLKATIYVLAAPSQDGNRQILRRQWWQNYLTAAGLDTHFVPLS